MGVLNVTPDSFSDGGRFTDPAAALRRATEMLDAGAAVIDVGGESTRPGAEPIEPAEECRRVLPVFEAVVPLAVERGARVSIDTRNEATARAAVAAGASLLNDVSASLWTVAADLGVGWVAMHMAGDPRTMQADPRYDDVVDEVRRFLVDRARRATAAGVAEVWVDPGPGFGRARTLALVSAQEQADVAAPVALDDRVDASLATATWAMAQGASMVRAHDVAVTVQAATIVAGGFPVT